MIALMHHLGIVNGQLRDDMIHVWHDAGPMADLCMVVKAILANQGSKYWIAERNPQGLEKTHFLLADKKVVKLVLSPGLVNGGDLIAVIPDFEQITVDEPLASFPCHSIESSYHCLISAMGRSASHEGKSVLIEALLKRLEEMSFFIYLNPNDQAAAWGELENALIAALERNLCPRAIAGCIRQHLSTLPLEQASE